MGKVWNVSHLMVLSKQYGNLDAHIHSKNELKETHSLATIITQPQSRNSLTRKPIPRLKQEKLKTVETKDAEMHYFKGLKNVQLLLLKVLCQQNIIQQKPVQISMDLIQSMYMKPVRH